MPKWVFGVVENSGHCWKMSHKGHNTYFDKAQGELAALDYNLSCCLSCGNQLNGISGINNTIKEQ